MKKILIVLLSLVVLTGCGSKESDLDTRVLLENALNANASGLKGGADLDLSYSIGEKKEKMTLDATAIIRQNGEITPQDISARDFSKLEMKLEGSVLVPGTSSTMKVNAFINDGTIYMDIMGQKIKTTLDSALSQYIDVVGNMESLPETSEVPKIEITEEQMASFDISKEKGYYRYTVKREKVLELLASMDVDLEPSRLAEISESLKSANLYIEVNRDETIRSIGVNFKDSIDEVKIEFKFRIVPQDLEGAKKIEFPSFDEYIDANQSF